MRSFLRRVAPAAAAFALVTGATAAEYLVQLEGYPEALQASSSGAIQQQLEDAHTAAFRRLSPGLSAIGLAEAEVEHFWINNCLGMDLTAAQAARVAELPGVMGVRPNQQIPLPAYRQDSVPAPRATITWSVANIKAPEAWEEFGVDGSGVVVGHIDTGIDPSHPDLAGKVIAFRDFVDSDNTQPKDGEGHGTHTAGTIVGGDAGGTAVGVAPGAKLVVARVLDEKGANTFRLLRSMSWMMNPDGDKSTDDAPAIGSNSWGSILGVDPSFWLTVKSWRKAGIVPVFANGNEGPDPKTTGIPGGYPHSFAVGATTRREDIAYFSSRGPVRWLHKTYIKPDVSAPGQSVYSTRDGGGYTTLSGTSMATPAVAGALALLYQKRPGLSVEAAERLLTRTARDKGAAGKDNDFGAGIIDVHAAMKRLK